MPCVTAKRAPVLQLMVMAEYYSDVGCVHCATSQSLRPYSRHIPARPPKRVRALSFASFSRRAYTYTSALSFRSVHVPAFITPAQLCAR